MDFAPFQPAPTHTPILAWIGADVTACLIGNCGGLRATDTIVDVDHPTGILQNMLGYEGHALARVPGSTAVGNVG